MSDTKVQVSGRWHIRLLGSLEVVTPCGKSISVTGKKTGELLAFLALHPHRSHTREKLIDLIWGESEVGDARTRLRQEILKLRSILAIPEADSFPLVITKDTCQLSSEVIVDALQFEDSCLRASREKYLDCKRRLYLEGVELYASDLLPGYDPVWIVGERARLSHCYSRALHDLGECQRLLKEYAGAENSLGLLLQHDRHSEEGHIALMRLYADLGQPTRVQQQLQVMVAALQDGLGIEPTSGSIRLAEALREQAGRCAAGTTLALSSAPPSDDGTTVDTPTRLLTDSQDIRALTPISLDVSATPQAISYRGRSFKGRWQTGAVVLLAIILICAATKWRAVRLAGISKHAMPPPVLRNSEKWVYHYNPRAGELPSSEGKAVAADASGIYVAGLIQTKTEDTDILTLKVSPEGRLIWADRYSSPEHDCDRAFSLCLDGKEGLYVGGETYVPAHLGAPGGWRLTLLRYNRNGKGLSWVRRSAMPVQNDGQLVKVCSDGFGGCYLCGTAMDKGSHSALVMRYDQFGRLVWQRTVHTGTDTAFHWCVVPADKSLCICGRARREVLESGINDVWLTACLDSAGHVRWQKLEDGPAHGSSSADRITVDRGGNVFVAGVFNTGDAERGGHGQVVGLVKYSPDGTKLWERLANDTGPNIALDTLGINYWGNSDLGGTEQHDDGSRGIVFVRYDSVGNKKCTWRYPLPANYKSASVGSSFLWGNESILFMGQVSRSIAMQEESSLLFATCSAGGVLLNQSLFSDTAGLPNSVTDFATNGTGIVLTGQMGLANGHNALMLLQY